MNQINVQNTFDKLRSFCEAEDFKGFDPFDGLNSKVFQFFPFLNKFSYFKLAWIQFFKRSPINFRAMTGIKKDYNPKGLGLFLSAYCNLYKIEPSNEILEKIHWLIKQILHCQTSGYSGSCWGYNFDWQARAFLQPKGTPSVVVTSYIAGALLDAFEITNDQNVFEIAKSSCEFILCDLNRTYDEDGTFSFSYCPLDQTQVFNASLLGVRLLCRVYAINGDKRLIEESRKAIEYVCKRQNPDGSWPYSPLPFHRWIDNFHTGYNLESIHAYVEVSKDHSFDKCFNNGFDYYVNSFFEIDGKPKYFNNSTFPIDLHNTAQLIVTLHKLKQFQKHTELASKVLTWSLKNMFDKEKGYFYYSKTKWYTNKIPYIRWTQAWMMMGMSYYLLELNKSKSNSKYNAI